VKSIPEETRDIDIVNSFQAGQSGTSTGEKYKVLIITSNENIYFTIFETLKYFSLNKKELLFLKGSDINEAKKVFESNPDIILIVIDKNQQVNGSLDELLTYIQSSSVHQSCSIVLGDNHHRVVTGIEKSSHGDFSEFEYAKDRLVDMIRMIVLTSEMETKISRNEPDDSGNDDNIAGKTSEKSSEINGTKDKLYTILAHDMKEPVGNIKVMIDFLANEPELLDKKTSRALLFSVRESANVIHELLDNFIFWTRLYKQDIHFNPVKLNIAHLIRENITLMKSSAANKQITLYSDFDDYQFVYADEYMVTTVLRNLIYNAIKFTGKNGKVIVSARKKNEALEIRIIDTGVGMAQKDIENLFRSEVYFSTKGTARENGIGLGLILCRDFIIKNGGNITVESKQGVGSIFSFTLPLWKEIQIN
jgi:signal transduction histidine kinase